LEAEYQKRHNMAVQARVSAYEQALAKLKATPGWEQLNEEQQKRVSAPLSSRSDPKNAAAQSIPLLRADVHACPVLLSQAVEEVLRYVDGNRVVRVTASSYFSGGIETEEQLDQALDGLKEQCLELIGAGKKILVQ
ncbi:MAG: BREX system P-loop protein BrxC, partial [Anaerolineae bacterium]